MPFWIIYFRSYAVDKSSNVTQCFVNVIKASIRFQDLSEKRYYCVRLVESIRTLISYNLTKKQGHNFMDSATDTLLPTLLFPRQVLELGTDEQCDLRRGKLCYNYFVPSKDVHSGLYGLQNWTINDVRSLENICCCKMLVS